jgi:Aldo/keto reductase family
MQLTGPGIWGPPQDRDAAIAALRRAVDLGISHIDTSHAYGPQVANQLIRQALHPYPAELVVATKVGVVRDRSRAFVAAAKPVQLRDQVERNLRGLGVDRLDLVYLRVGHGDLCVVRRPGRRVLAPITRSLARPLYEDISEPGSDVTGDSRGCGSQTILTGVELSRLLSRIASRWSRMLAWAVKVSCPAVLSAWVMV